MSEDTAETLIDKLLKRSAKSIYDKTAGEIWYKVNINAREVLGRKCLDNLDIIIKEWIEGTYDGIGATTKTLLSLSPGHQGLQSAEYAYLVGYQSGDTSDKDYYEKEKRPFLKFELLKILQAQSHTTVGSKLEEMKLYDDAIEWYRQNEMEKEEKELKEKMKEVEESKGSASDRLKKGDNQFKNFWGDKLILLDDRVELILTEKSPSLKGESADRYDIGKTRIHYDGLKMSFSKKRKWIEFGQNNSWGKGIIHFKNLAKWQRIEEMIYEAKKNYGKNPIQQTIIHGDYVDDRDTTYIDDRDTIIKDSVLNRSNVGAGGKSKGEQIKVIKDLLDSGAIDDDEFKQMKKEILGK